MTGYNGQVTEDLDRSQGIDVHNNSVKAKEVIDKVKAVILTSKPNKAQENLALSTILSHLDDVYEIFVEQAIELAVAKSEIETLPCVWLRNTCVWHHTLTPHCCLPEEQNKNKEKITRPGGSRGTTRAAGPSIDHD